MTEKKYQYTTKIKQPQTVGKIRLDPKGGTITEQELKLLKKDPYGASLIEKGLLVMKEYPAPPATLIDDGDEDEIPDLESAV